MKNKLFIDTNIWLYVFLHDSGEIWIKRSNFGLEFATEI
jgi:predicted nucleic acid-binding protein